MTDQYRVLVVDDTPAIHHDFAKILNGPGFGSETEVDDLAEALFPQDVAVRSAVARPSFLLSTALRGQDGCDLLEAGRRDGVPFSIAFVDMRMPGGWDGLETLEHMFELDEEFEAVICTAYSDYSWHEIVERLGQTDRLLILKKPFDPIEVLQLGHALGAKWSLRRAASERLEALRNRHAELQGVIDGTDVGISLKSRDGLYHRVNRAFCEAVGRTAEELIGKSDAKVFGDALAEEISDSEAMAWRGAAVRRTDSTDPRIPSRIILTSRYLIDGSDRSPQLLCTLSQDVTAYRELQKRLLESQKMEAIGQIASGVAHDFNNMLAAVLGASELVKDDLAADDPCRHEMDLIVDTCQRAVALTNKLLAFSRTGTSVSRQCDIHRLTRDAIALCKYGAGRSLEWVSDLQAESYHVSGDPGQLQSAILNLCLNACDATGDHGVFRISSENVAVTEESTDSPEELAPGEYIKLTASDDGHGMSAEIQAQIFTPFFTTKPTGRGTGLGLAVVYGTVAAHNGTIEVESAVGEGTTFWIHLPVCDSAAPGPASAVPATGSSESRSGNVLVVDDDDSVRQVTVKILERLGFTVTTAVDGEEGLKIFRESHGEIDLVVLDMVMPKLGGEACVRQMIDIAPGVRVLIATGFTRAKSLEELMATHATIRFISKPYRRSDLAAAIDEIMPA